LKTFLQSENTAEKVKGLLWVGYPISKVPSLGIMYV
jgi:hypothetical protein